MILTQEEFEKRYGGQKTLTPQQFNSTYNKPPEKKSFLQKASGVMDKVTNFVAPGAKKLGQTFGDALAVKSKDVKGAQASQAGLDDMNVKLGEAIKAGKKEGKDTSKLEALYKSNTENSFDVGEVAPSVNKTGKQIAGEALGTAVDIAGWGKFGSAVAKAPLTSTNLLKQGAKAGALWGSTGAGAYAMAEGKDNRAILEGMGVGAVAGAVLGGVLLPVTGGVLRKAANALSPSVDYMTGKMQSQFARGVKPLLGKMKTSSAKDSYYKNALDSAEIITVNKDKMKFTNLETGEIEKGRLPKNLAEFSQSIEQMKKDIYRSYDDIAQKSNLVIDLKDGGFNAERIANKVNELTSDLSNSPEVRKYAGDIMEEVVELKGQPASVIQSRIQELNSSLAGFYEGRVTKAKARIDASVANLMREELDDLIMRTTGDTKYSELKKMYGSLSSIERDVNRRAVAVSRNNEKGLTEGLTDMFSGGDLIMGALSGNPAQMARGFGVKAIGQYIKNLNSPDKNVERFFQSAEKMLEASKKESLLQKMLRGANKEFDVDKKIIDSTKTILDNQSGFQQIGPKGSGAIRSTTNGLTTSIQKAKASGQSFDEWVKGQTKMLHGTTKKFDKFDTLKLATNEKDLASRNAFFFTDSLETAKSYGKEVKELYGNPKKPITLDADGKMYGDMREEINDAVLKAKNEGNDVVIIKNLSDRKDWGNYEPATHYAVIDTNQLKTRSQLKAEWDKVK
jgi:hypothetical protein